jgi:hypothetical protein
MVEFLPAGREPATGAPFARITKLEKDRVVSSSVRFTITDCDGMVSFVGPGHAIKMLVAACSYNPQSLDELLDLTQRLDDVFITNVRHGLAVFDEHNLRTNTTAFDRQAAEAHPAALPPFRVYNEMSRNIASNPVQAGLIIFNLMARRIVQVQNSYSEIKRADRGRFRRSGKPTSQLYHYTLSNEWALVP